jgi:dUTP pyrophosphatase
VIYHLQIVVLDEELYRPDIDGTGMMTPQHIGDAGLDLRARESARVGAGTTEVIPLGVAVQLPRQHVGWLTGRSTTHVGMGLFVHEGKIDSGYRGEIHCFCTALGSPVHIERGDRLCQIVAVHISEPSWQVVEELSRSERGEAGLGSTGRA